MALLLILAAAAPFVNRARRGPALYMLAAGLILLLVPIFTTMYDARYVVPALGPLAAAAAFAVDGFLVRRLQGPSGASNVSPMAPAPDAP